MLTRKPARLLKKKSITVTHTRLPSTRLLRPRVPYAQPCDGQSTNFTDLRPFRWFPISANRRYIGVSHVPLSPIGVDPPKPVAATAVVGARRQERDFTAGFSHRCVFSDPEESPLLQGELRDDRLPGARALAPLPSVLSPRSHMPLRRVDLPLPFPSVRSAAGHSRPYVLRSRDAWSFGPPDNRRRLPDQRRFSIDLRSDDRLRNRMLTRRLQSPGGSFLGRTGTCQHRIIVFPQRSRHLRRSCRRINSCVSSCLIWQTQTKLANSSETSRVINHSSSQTNSISMIVYFTLFFLNINRWECRFDLLGSYSRDQVSEVLTMIRTYNLYYSTLYSFFTPLLVTSIWLYINMNTNFGAKLIRTNRLRNLP